MEEIKTGRIYTGRQALQIGLVDAIGDEQTAIKWFTDVAQSVAGFEGEGLEASKLRFQLIPSLHGEPRREVRSWIVIDASVLESLDMLKDRPLDGLFSIWHPHRRKVTSSQNDKIRAYREACREESRI